MANLATDIATDLDPDERLFNLEDAMFGRTVKEVDDLEVEFGSAKVDVWCAWTHLTATAADLRRAVGMPADGPVMVAYAKLAEKSAAGDERCARMLALFDSAATVMEGARVALAEVRGRA